MSKTLSRKPPSGSCAGFTLVELMVGVLVGLFIMGAVITVFVESERSLGQDERLHQLQESGRFTLQLLAGEPVGA